MILSKHMKYYMRVSVNMNEDKFIDDFERLKDCNKKRVDDSIDFFITMPIEKYELPKEVPFILRPLKKKYFGLMWDKGDIFISTMLLLPAVINSFSGNFSSMFVHLIIFFWFIMCMFQKTQRHDMFLEFRKASLHCSNVYKALAYLRAEYEDLYNNTATHKMKDKK